MTREQILQRRQVKTVTVPAPEMGEGATLNVRRLSAREFMDLNNKVKADPDTAYVKWLIATVADDAGNSVFSDDDAQAVAELEVTLVERLVDEAQRLNISTKATGPNPQPRPADSPTP